MDAATVKQLVTALRDPSMYDEDGIMHITQDAMWKIIALIDSLQTKLECVDLGREWIPFSEKSLPPDNRQTVLLSDGEDYCFGWRNPSDEMHYVDDCLASHVYQRDKMPYKFKHWMFLPELPKAGDPE